MQSNSRPRVAVIGLGGIGLGFAAALHEGAQATVLGCARRDLGALSIERDGSTAPIDIPVVLEPDGLEPVDWIVVATKVPQTGTIAPWLAALCDERTRVVVAQNGIHRDRALAALAPQARAMLPAVIYFNGESNGDGLVRFRHAREVDVLLPQNEDARDFATLLAPFMLTRVDPEFADTSWRKLLLNVAANSLTALTMQRTEILRDPDIRSLALDLMEEAAAVARADGAPLAESAPREMLEILLAYPPEVATSMYLDRLARRRTEVEAFNGAVVDLGRRHGIACPKNEVVRSLLRALDAKSASG